MTTNRTTLAAAAIIRAARNNPHITAAGLQDELERGDIGGWMKIASRYSLTIGEWSGAMQIAISRIEAETLRNA